MSKFKQRKNKIRSILGAKYSEEIIEAISEIPQGIFAHSGHKYLPSHKPYIGGWDLFDIEYVALLLSQIQNSKKCSALVLGSGNGYFLSILAKQYHEVISYESNKYLVEECMDKLGELNIDNAITLHQDYYEADEFSKTYDLVVVNFALKEKPKRYIELLDNQGILLYVLAETDYVWPDEPQTLIVIKRNEKNIEMKEIAEVYIPPVIRKL